MLLLSSIQLQLSFKKLNLIFSPAILHLDENFQIWTEHIESPISTQQTGCTMKAAYVPLPKGSSHTYFIQTTSKEGLNT